METTGYGLTTPSDPTLVEAAESARGVPLRIRVQPQVFIEGAYTSWKNAIWSVRCSFTEAQALRETLRVFFQAVGEMGPERLGAELVRVQTAWRMRAVGATTAAAIAPVALPNPAANDGGGAVVDEDPE